MTFQKRRLRRSLLGGTILGIALAFWQIFPPAAALERALLDFRYSHFNRDTEASADVIVIDIDEQSLKLLAPSYGRWPLPRRIYKDLIEFLAIGNPAAVLFDVLFTEPMLGSEDDALFASATAASGFVSHAVNLLEEPAEVTEGTVNLPDDFKNRFSVQLEHPAPNWLKGQIGYRDFLLPTQAYLQVTPKTHIVTFHNDSDGGFRRARLLFPYEDTWLPSLTLTALSATMAEPRVSANTSGGLTLRDTRQPEKLFEIPVEKTGFLPIHFYQLEKAPMSVPFAAVLDSAIAIQRGEVTDPAQLKFNPLEIKGKILIIGSSAVGVHDLKPTPVHPAYPGVMLHATAISNILMGDYLKNISWWVEWAFALALVTLTYWTVFGIDSIFLKVPLPLGALGVYSALSFWLFKTQSLHLNLSLPIGAVLVALFDGLTYLSFVEGIEKRRLQGTLSKYLSPQVMAQVISQGGNPQAEVGSRKSISILFCDIHGFTTFAENQKAEHVVAELNRYLGAMTDVVFLNQGTLDKFIGDAIMAFWGAPITDPDHAKHAVQCGFAILEGIKNKELNTPFRAGVGINTGEAIVGNLGSEKRLDYTVIGDAVNTASRFEALTRSYHIPFLIGEQTTDLIKDSFITRIIDKAQVKGKENYNKIYEPIAESQQDVSRDKIQLAEKTEKAWTLYEEGHFQAAYEAYEALHRSCPEGDPVSQIFMERCKVLLKSPPASWEGVFSRR